MDGRTEPGLAMDLGEQRAARRAAGFHPARRPGDRKRAVPAADAERGQKVVRVLGCGVQQPAQVRVQTRGQRHGQSVDQDPQGTQERPDAIGVVANDGSGCRVVGHDISIENK